jgi:hypothetical protein
MLDFTNIKIDTAQPSFVKTVSHEWSWKDYLGAIKVRSAFRRYSHIIQPGIYAMGKPGKDSDIFVSANYKLSFDILRRDLAGINTWILVLDTKGINVWCAAGKGTFGTSELINRISKTQLESFVSHKKLIVPQLGAVGIAAHEVTKQTGFKIIYGPVRSSDIKAFINNNYLSTPEMRSVLFNMTDRIILTPVEIAMSLKYALIACIALFVLSCIHGLSFSLQYGYHEGIASGILIIAAYLSGTFITPILLPFLPGRAFAVKGAVMGLICFIALLITGIITISPLPLLSWLLIFLSVSSFLGMNFTGASTYTSISGVEKEMKYALPLQISAAALGVILFIVSRFLI